MKDQLEKVFDSIAASIVSAQEDYTDKETGLLHCGKCHTPIQCRVTLFDKEKLMPCTCRCLYRKRPHRAGHTRPYDELFKNPQQLVGNVQRGQEQIPCQFWRV